MRFSPTSTSISFRCCCFSFSIWSQARRCWQKSLNWMCSTHSPTVHTQRVRPKRRKGKRTKGTTDERQKKTKRRKQQQTVRALLAHSSLQAHTYTESRLARTKYTAMRLHWSYTLRLTNTDTNGRRQCECLIDSESADQGMKKLEKREWLKWEKKIVIDFSGSWLATEISSFILPSKKS